MSGGHGPACTELKDWAGGGLAMSTFVTPVTSAGKPALVDYSGPLPDGEYKLVLCLPEAVGGHPGLSLPAPQIDKVTGARM